MSQNEPGRPWWHSVADRPWAVSLLVLLVALGVRLGHLGEATQSPLMRDVIPMFDSQYYDKVAREVAEGDFLGDEVFFMAPLYPYALAIPYRVLRQSGPDSTYVYDITAVRYIQAVIGALTCVLLYWVGRLTVGASAALLASLMAAVYGVFVYYDGIIMPTATILMLNLLALLLLLLARRTGAKKWWIAGGFVLGLCAVAHGTALLTIVAVLAWVWLGFRSERRSWRFARLTLVAAAAGCVIGSVTLRNWIVGNDFVLLTSNAGKNLYVGNSPTATGTYDDSVTYVFPRLWGSHLSHYLADIERTDADRSPSQMSRYLAGASLKFMREHPLQEAGLLIRKFHLFFSGTELFINDNFHFARRYSTVLRLAALGFGLVVPIGLTGLYFSLRRGRADFLVVMSIAAQVLAFTLMFVLCRYRLVFVACLMLFAGAQIVWWVEQLRARQYRPLLWSFLPLALFTLWVHLPVYDFPAERGYGQQHAIVGRILMEQGRMAEARVSFAHALTANFDPWVDRNGQLADCHLRLGLIHERTGRPHDALVSYKRALQRIQVSRAPDQRKVVWLQERVKALRGS